MPTTGGWANGLRMHPRSAVAMAKEIGMGLSERKRAKATAAGKSAEAKRDSAKLQRTLQHAFTAIRMLG